MNGRIGEAEMPLDMQLDLLVDGELGEAERATFLRRIEAAAGWRALAVRFLQRQVERETARELLAGGRVVPPDMLPPARILRFPQWMTMRGLGMAAAGLLIAVASAVVTLLAMRPAATGAPMAVQPEMYSGSVALNAVGAGDGTLRFEVPVTPVSYTSAESLFPIGRADEPPMRRNMVIQPDGRGGFVVIPVNTVSMRAY